MFAIVFTIKSEKMNRKLLITLALSATTISAFAGGYVHNSNQNVAYLRNQAQNAVIGVQGAYFNPAGIGFMDNGFYLALDVNTAIQKRISTTTYAPLSYGVDNGGKPYKRYEGKSFVPVLPHFDLAYKHDNWFGSFHFGVISGGGACTYDNGLGSFEAPVAMIPGLVNNIAGMTLVSAYDVDSDLVGEQYNYSGQLNLGYKINEHWSVSAGLRANLVSNKYVGNINDIRLTIGGNSLTAADALGSVLSMVSGGAISAEQGSAMAGAIVGDKKLDAKQKDLAFTPIISVHYKTGKFDFAGRYEFNTKVRLKNETKENSTGVAQFNDGKVVAADLPANLNLGATYSPRKDVRISAGFNYYFDKQSKLYNDNTDKNDKQDYLKHNSYEILGGVEWDVNKFLTLSLGVNSNTFGFGEEAKFISDMSFSTSSVSGGLGARLNISPKVALDLAVYKTFFLDFSKEQADYGGYGRKLYDSLSPLLGQLAQANPGLAEKFKDITPEKLAIPGTDDFTRKSIVFGLGVTFAF